MISKSITEGFKFALSLKRLIPYIILDLIIFYVLIGFFSNFIGMLRSEGFNLIGFFISFGLFIPAFIIIGLVQLWMNGAIIDQARYFPRERPLKGSFEYSTSRYLTMLCAMIIFSVITWILSLPKYVGSILVFAITLLFYYLYPVIIVDKKKCVDAFNKSYKTFMRYPLETFLTWLVSVIISLIIIGVFALPLIFLFLGNIIETWGTIIPTAVGVDVESGGLIGVIISGMMESARSPFFVPYLFILVVALSFTKVFNLGVQTRLYINTRKIEL